MKSKKTPATITTLIIAIIIGLQFQLLADSGQVIYSKVLFKVFVSACSYALSQNLFGNTDEDWYSFKRSILVSLSGSIFLMIGATLLDGYFDYWSQKTLGILVFSEFISFWIGDLVMRILVLSPIISIFFIALYNAIRLLLLLFQAKRLK